MPLKYSLIYYAVFVVLTAISYLVHPLFYFVLFSYLFILIKRFGKKMFFLLLFIPIILRPMPNPSIPTILKGRVKDLRENYVLVNTSYGTIKAYTDYVFHYDDEILVKVKPLEIKHRKDEIGFDEYRYLKSNCIVSKVKILHVTSVTSHPSFYSFLEKRFSDSKKVRSYQKMFLFGIKDESIKEDYSLLTSLSLVHMFALSGMHIHLLYRCLSLLKYMIREDIADFLIKIMIGFYVFSIPYNISLHRAFWVLILNDLLKEQFNSLDVLSILVIYQIIKNPYVIWSLSFIFSYQTFNRMV